MRGPGWGRAPGDHRASVEFRNSEKNWKIEPNSRINAAPSANRAKQMAERHPRTAAIATVSRRGNRAATNAAARAPNMLPAALLGSDHDSHLPQMTTGVRPSDRLACVVVLSFN